MMVEMDVKGTDDVIPVVVLNFIETFGEFTDVMVVNESDRPRTPPRRVPKRLGRVHDVPNHGWLQND